MYKSVMNTLSLRNQNSVYLAPKLYSAMVELNGVIRKDSPCFNLVCDFEDHRAVWAIYEGYPVEQRKQIFDDFLDYAKIIVELSESSNSLNDNKRALWAVMSSLEVHPGSDILERLEGDDIIEVYRADGIQVFRSLSFHHVCSYGFPDLFVLPWSDLYSRSEIVNQLIQEAAMTVFTGKAKGTLNLDHIPVHKLAESVSQKKYRTEMRLRFLHPLKSKSGATDYLIAVSKVRLLEKSLGAGKVVELRN